MRLLLTMHTTVPLLCCLACAGHARRAPVLHDSLNEALQGSSAPADVKNGRSTAQARRSNASKVFAMLLEALSATAGWQLAGAGFGRGVALKTGCPEDAASSAAALRSMPARHGDVSLLFGKQVAIAEPRPTTSPPLADRVFLVTGATDGIGKYTAELLALEGSTVLIHGRDAAKIAATLDELQKRAPAAKLEGFKADLSLMSEVRRLAAEISAKYPVLHGLLNNAGTYDGDYTGRRVVTDEGNEYSLAVNVLAPFLLTSLLMSNVQASSAGRVIMTSSYALGSKDALKDLQLETKWTADRAYSLSKLCINMITAEMHARYGDAPRLSFHTMDPGTVDTKMRRARGYHQGWSVRTASTSFKMLTEEVYQLTSGRRVASCLPLERSSLWFTLASMTGAAWPSIKKSRELADGEHHR
mmetsp:Transcript_100241/g.188981  ORF Transcript_100241/g.188981 Transcript_100241/m.188981 type:complete len:415 (-) Transcript_100241:151-1395(-)